MNTKRFLAWFAPGLLGPLVASCMSAGVTPGDAEPEEVAEGPAAVQQDLLIAICHASTSPPYQQTVWVSFQTVNQHLAHGDYLGPCTGQCTSAGGQCSQDAQCCSGDCESGECVAGSCMGLGQQCSHDAQCCSGSCYFGVCINAPGGCLRSGQECSHDAQCCSGACYFGACD